MIVFHVCVLCFSFCHSYLDLGLTFNLKDWTVGQNIGTLKQNQIWNRSLK